MNLRRLLIGIAIAIVVIVIALFVAVSLVNINKFRPQIQAELESKLNRPVALGQMHLHIFPLSIKVDGITIGEPTGFPANPPFVRAKEVSASASLGSIFGGTPEIRDLTLTDPQVELIQNAQGVWNFSNIGSAPAPAQPGAVSNKPAAQAGAKPAAANNGTTGFTLNQLKVVDGQIAVTNERTKSPRAVYNHIDVTLSNFAPDKQFSIAADVHFHGPGKELLSFNGTGGPLATRPGQITPLNGSLSLQQISLASLNSVAPGVIPPNTDASMSGNAVIATGNKMVTCKGGLTLSNPSVRGAKINYPILTKYDFSLNQSNDQFVIQSGSVTIGPSVV
ncbi:MAG: AsmA family protein, partial [Bryobacteraceae bacterium]